MYYGAAHLSLVSILNSVGITNSLQQTAYNGGLQLFNWFAAIFGALVCERYGRRKMWLASAIGMFFSYVLITGCSAAYANGKEQAGKGVLAFLFVYFFFYDIGYSGLTLAYPLEILPFSLRSKGMAILMFCSMGSLCFNVYVNPIALTAIAWKYYFVFLAVLLVAIVCIYFVFPETKGLFLEEIAVIFDGEDAALSTQGGHHGEDLKDEEQVETAEIPYNNAKAA